MGISRRTLIPAMLGAAWTITQVLSAGSPGCLSGNSIQYVSGGSSEAGEEESDSTAGTKADRSLIRLVAGYSDNASSFDPFVIYYDSRSTYNFDGQFDALKLLNTDISVPNFYVFAGDDKSLSISALPFTGDSICTLRLGLKTERDGAIVIRIKDISGFYNNMVISLTDKLSGEKQLLTPENEYQVSLAKGDYQDRFYLSLSAVVSGVTEVPAADNWLKAYSVSGALRTEINLPDGTPALLKMYDLAGQLVFISEVPESGYREFYPRLRDGIFIVSLESRFHRKSQKIAFRN